MQPDFYVGVLVDHVLQDDNHLDGLVEVGAVRENPDRRLQRVLERDTQSAGDCAQYVGVERFELQSSCP